MLRLAFRPLLAGLMLAAPFVLASCGEGSEAIDILGSGPPEDVSVVVANHTGSVVCIVRENEALGGCDVAANGGFRPVHMSLRNGQVVSWDAYISQANPTPLTHVSCKWRGETVMQVDYQVPAGSTEARLLCVGWSPP